MIVWLWDISFKVRCNVWRWLLPTGISEKPEMKLDTLCPQVTMKKYKLMLIWLLCILWSRVIIHHGVQILNILRKGLHHRLVGFASMWMQQSFLLHQVRQLVSLRGTISADVWWVATSIFRVLLCLWSQRHLLFGVLWFLLLMKIFTKWLCSQIACQSSRTVPARDRSVIGLFFFFCWYQVFS